MEKIKDIKMKVRQIPEGADVNIGDILTVVGNANSDGCRPMMCGEGRIWYVWPEDVVLLNRGGRKRKG